LEPSTVKEIGMIFSNISTGNLLVCSGAGCGTMKAESGLADLEKKETQVGDEIEREQQKIDRVNKEIEQLKRDAGK